MKKLLTSAAIIIATTLLFASVFEKTHMGGVIFETMRIEDNLEKSFDNCTDMEFTGDFATDYNNCNFPDPQTGKWKAIYTQDFAMEYNLPPENITNNLNNGVAYMEMETIRRTNDTVACVTNMLVKTPNDISKWGWEHSMPKLLPDDRKLLHLVDIQKNAKKLNSLGTFSSLANSDYTPKTDGFLGSTKGLYAENVLPNYDYFTVSDSCGLARRLPQYYPDNYVLYVRKASVWSKYGMRYNGFDDPDWPKDVKPMQSYLKINIPAPLIKEIFKITQKQEAK